MKRVTVIITSFAVTLLFLRAGNAAYAEIQVEVEGNGTGTENSITTNQEVQQEHSQNNTTEISNTVDQSATTGGNAVSDSTGDVTIQTGDIQTSTTIENQGNTSTSESGCCLGDQTVTVSGNGANSQNAVTGTISVNTTVTVTNNAHITNTITGQADTGNNHANNNTGSVSIATGSISAKTKIITVANQATELVKQGTGDVTVKIVGNGADSVNDVSVKIFETLLLTKNNTAKVDNNIFLDLNTGSNTADKNVGVVEIKTGDINSEVIITNGPINTNITETDCCDDDEDKEEPNNPPEEPKVPPTGGGSNPPSTSGGNGGNGGGGSSNGIGGSVLGATTGLLPVTGIAFARTSWMWAVVYLVMFLCGLYVRLRAGRSPTYAVAR